MAGRLKEYVEAQTKHGYGTPSEYVRELIREDQKHRAKEKARLAVLEGINSGDSIPGRCEVLERSQARGSRQAGGSPEESLEKMLPPVRQRPRARLDLLEQFVYFGSSPGWNWRDATSRAVNATCLQLIDHPQSGVSYDSGIASLEGLRRFPVNGFENYLVFYMLHQGGIEVIRILDGARDIDNVFAQEET